MNSMNDFNLGLLSALVFTDSPEHGTIGLLESEADKLRQIGSEFYQENKADINSFAKKHGVGVERVGNLVWYAWQGHGVGFFDYGECFIGETLENKALLLPYVHTYLSDCGQWLMCDILK